MTGISPQRELAEGTAHGDIYLRRLVRGQLALGLLGVMAAVGVLGGLPLLLYIAPGLNAARLLGVPLSVVLVVVPVYPLLVLVGWLYQRRADALDEAFRDLVRDEP